MGLFDRLFGRREGQKPRPPKEEAVSRPAPQKETGRREEEPKPASSLLAGNIQGQGQREGQEDSFALFNSSDPARRKEQGLLAIVADGMGGMEDGKAASETAVEVFRQRFLQWDGREAVPEWLYRGAFAANDQIFCQSRGLSGTTVTAVHILGDDLYWLSVGDSAIFLKRGEGVFQLNREHTYLNQLYAKELEGDVICKERAENDEDARRLTSFIGIDHLKEVDLNLRPWKLKEGDVILLCSDGISGVLTMPELKEAMSLSPDEGCALLETMVLEKGIPEQDNYTGVMIACGSK